MPVEHLRRVEIGVVASDMLVCADGVAVTDVF